LVTIFQNEKSTSTLDYVTGWFIKAAQYLRNQSLISNDSTEIITRIAFVSTNSISQGEQVGILWNELFNNYKCVINFAHRTFKWGNEAKGNAAVHCVIVGFSKYNNENKKIFEYQDVTGEPHETIAKNINGYLIEGNNVLLPNRTLPICNVPKMFRGNMPTDGGNLLLTESEYLEFKKNEPHNIKFIKPFISAHEFLNNKKRYCLWLIDANPKELIESKLITERLGKVKEMRLASSKKSTNRLAETPTLFELISQPKTNYVLIPRHSSENRKYIPFGYFSKDEIVADSCLAFPEATLYEFGVISCAIHMTWVKYVCGRLKSDFRYSNTIVYNNFPWPESPTDKQKVAVEKAAQEVLDVRANFPNSSLADLYDPLTMPPALVKAHNALDKAVDLCYRSQPFANETKRIEFLFELYDKYTAGLFVKEKKRKKVNSN
jgi:hypothetical protein